MLKYLSMAFEFEDIILNAGFSKKILKEEEFGAKLFKILSGRVSNSHMKKN